MWVSCGQQGRCPWFIHTALLGPVRRTRPSSPQVILINCRNPVVYKNAVCLFVCSVCPGNQLTIRTRLLVQWFAQVLMRASHPSGSRLLVFHNGKKYQRPWLIRAPENCRCQALSNCIFKATALMVLRRNGPDPLWFKAWAYQAVLTVDKTLFSRLRGLPIRLYGC